MRKPLLPRQQATKVAGDSANSNVSGPLGSLQWPFAEIVPLKSAVLCFVYVLLSASGPILMDWVKRSNGGTFPFMIPALTFHAWATAVGIGAGWAVASGKETMRKLRRPDMLWRFMLTTSMFTCGDMLSFMSMEHLDVGTFSLVGKAFAIAITVGLTRVVLGKKQTRLQYTLVVLVVASTIAFCRSEQVARGAIASGGSWFSRGSWPEGQWFLGLGQRTAAVALTSFGAVVQEKLLRWEAGVPFLIQQCWMGIGALCISFFALRVLHGLPTSALLTGFDNWRVLVLLGMYVANGLTTGLMVKRLGAVAKALCVPIYLGGCYFYAVQTGSATLTLQVILAWSVSTACILLFAVTKATGSRKKWEEVAKEPAASPA